MLMPYWTSKLQNRETTTLWDLLFNRVRGQALKEEIFFLDRQWNYKKSEDCKRR